MKYREVHRYRPFDLIAPEFGQVDAPTDGLADGLIMTAEGPPAPFAAVEIRVEARGQQAKIVAGLAGPDGDEVLAAYDVESRRATLELRTGGRTRVVGAVAADLEPPFGFAFAVCENSLTALADIGGGGWLPLVTTRKNVATFMDLRNADFLAGLRYAYGLRVVGGGQLAATSTSCDPDARISRIRRALARISPSRPAPSSSRDGCTPVISSVRAGLLGKVGVRDLHVVQHADGTPYLRDGRLYLTLTCAGLGFFPQAHWGVFTLDLNDLTRLEQVAQIYFARDGLVLGDHAGQIVVDGEEFIVAVSTWGDFTPGNISVRHTRIRDDVLSGVHVLDSRPLELPTSVGAWDPALTRIDGRWHVGFVESPTQVGRFEFRPALAVGPAGSDYDVGLELVGSDLSMRQCEGPVLAEVDGHWRLLASDGDSRDYPIYDLTMRRVGSVDAPYGTNIPHPQVVTVPGAAGPRHLLLTFDGTQYAEDVLGYGGHGDLVILEAD